MNLEKKICKDHNSDRRVFLHNALCGALASAGLAVSPSSLAFFPLLARIFLTRGLVGAAARGGVLRGTMASGSRALGNTTRRAGVKRSAKIAAAATGGGSTAFAGQTFATEAIWQVLLNVAPGDRVTYSSLHNERFDGMSNNLDVWGGDKAESIFLALPPLTQAVQDSLAWAAHDVVSNELIKLGQCPVSVQRSEKPGFLELPIGRLDIRGPHRFMAVFEYYGNQLPIISSEIVEVV